MERDVLRALVVDDNPGDRRLVAEMLHGRAVPAFEVVQAGRLGEALEVVGRTHIDVVLLDLGLPDSQGLEGVEALARLAPGLPVVVLTSLDDEETGLLAVRSHASDFLVKGRIDDHLLARSIRYAIERKRAEEALRRSREEAAADKARLEAVLEALPVGVAILDERGGQVQCNPGFKRVWGTPTVPVHLVAEYAAYRAWWADSEAPVRPEEWASARAIAEKAPVTGQLLRIERFDGGGAYVSNSAAPILDAEGRVTGSAVAIMDVTAQVESERAIERAKQEWERTFDSVPDLIALLDHELRIVRVNRALADRLAMTPGECIGQPCYTCLHGTTEPVQDCPHTLTRADGREHVAEIHEERLGGDFFVSTTPLFDAAGWLTGMVHVARDISSLKSKERELRQLNRTLRALGNSNQAMLQATTEAQLLADVCRIVVEDCGHAMVWIGMAEDDEGKTVRPVAHAGLDDGYVAALNVTWADTERGRGPTGTAIRTGRPARCNDMLADPAFAPWREEARKRGYRSSLVVPLTGGAGPLGSLSIYSDKPNAFGDEEVALLSELAGDLAFGIRAIRTREARDEAERALGLSEQRYRALVDMSPDGVLVIRDGAITYANAAAVAMSGRKDAGQLVGRAAIGFFHPDFHPTIRERVDQVLGGAPVSLLEERAVRLDGSERDIEVAATRVELPEGPAIQVLLHDITERKQAEAEIRRALELSQRREAEVAALLHAARTALESRSFEDASRAIVASCKAVIGAPAGFVALLRPDGKEPEIVHVDPAGVESLAAAAATLGRDPLLERVLGSRQAGYDNARGPSPGHATEEHALAPLMLAPLAIGHEVAGVLALAAKPGGFSDDDSRLAEAFAEMASVALLNSRTLDILEAQVKERTRQLEAERARLFALLEELPLYVFLRAPDSSVPFANRYFREHFGEPTGRHCYELMGSSDAPCEGCQLASVLETGTGASWEWSAPDGRNYLIHNYPFTDSDGTKLVLELGIDVSELRRALQAEQDARRAADTLRDTSLELTRLLDLDTVLAALLAHARRVVPYDRAKAIVLDKDARLSVRAVVEQEGLKAFPFDTHARFFSAENPVIERILATGETLVVADIHTDPEWGRRVDPSFEHSWLGVPLTARGGVVGLFSMSKEAPGAFSDEEVRLAEALSALASVAVENALLFEEVQAARENMQTLSRRVVDAQENERRAIARELHDEAGQSLTSLLFGLGQLERGIDQRDEAVRRIAELKRTAVGVLDGLHRLAANLRPASLDHLGLVAALRQHLAGLEANGGLETRFHARGLDDERLPPEVETALYRVAQEALTNVVRHANASLVDVLAERHGERLVLMIEDNGTGFDPSHLMERNKLGLMGMRERAETLGGTLTVESSPGSGTTVVVEVPCVGPVPAR